MDQHTPPGANRVLAYLTDADCAALPGGDPIALLDRTTQMSLDGRLCGAPGRTVRPYLFLGRSTDGRLAYLCELKEA